MPSPEKQLARLEARFEVMSRVTRALAEHSTDYARLLDTIARELAVALKDICRVLLLREDGETLDTAAIHCADAELLRFALQTGPFRVSENPLVGQVLRSGKSSMDLSGLSASMDARASMAGLQSRLLVALCVDGKAIGVLGWARFSPESRPFDAHDQQLAEMLTEHVALAIKNARAYAAERAAYDRAASAEARYRALLDGAPDPIAMIDVEGDIVEVNRAWERAIGVPREQARGRRPADFLAESLRAERTADLMTFIARGGIDTKPPAPVRLRDGSEIQLELTRSLVDVGGGVHLVLSIARDVTDRLRLEAQLRDTREESDKRRARLRELVFDATVAEEHQRRRIAVDLHDRIGQQLALASIGLGSVREELQGACRAAVDKATSLLSQSIDDTRSLIFDLSPPVLYDLGLKAAVGWLAEDVDRQHGMKLEVADDGADKPLDDASNAIVFRAIRELTMNILKHAHATLAKVSLGRAGDQLEILVEDDGVGFDVDALAHGATGTFGLLSIHEQIACLTGTLSIESAPEQGTRVSIRVPLREAGP